MNRCGCPVTLTLTLGALSLDLMDPVNGFFIAQVDLGFPNVREVSTNRPDADGVIDETRWVGPRVVSVTGKVQGDTVLSRSARLGLLAPFLDPSVRPVLVYAIDGDQPARQLTLRGSDWSTPLDDPWVSDFHVAWKTADSSWAASDQLHTVSVPASIVAQGRTYTWTPPRHYPAGSQITAPAVNTGNRPTRPVFRVDGPITGPVIYGGGTISFLPAFAVPAGRYVSIDCGTRTVLLDGLYNVFGQVDFLNTTWPVFLPGVQNNIQLQGSATGPSTLLTCTWRDAWFL